MEQSNTTGCIRGILVAHTACRWVCTSLLHLLLMQQFQVNFCKLVDTNLLGVELDKIERVPHT